MFRKGYKPTEEQRKKQSEARKGIKLSLETRQKMSLAKKGKMPKNFYKIQKKAWEVNLGKKHSEEHKTKIAESHKGKKAYNYKGISSFDYLERRRFQQTIQKQIFERDNYKCVLCGASGDLQVDHIQSWADFVELRFSIDNCRTLCAKCHYFVTFGKPMSENIKGWGHNFLKGGALP